VRRLSLAKAGGRFDKDRSSLRDGSQSRGYSDCVTQFARRAANRAAESPEKFYRRASMESVTSQSARRCSSKTARTFRTTSREKLNATASFASADRQA